MRKMELIMGMPVVIEVTDSKITESVIDEVFDYFRHVDETFSTFKPTSEISRINDGDIQRGGYSPEMTEIFRLAEEIKTQTGGYFDIRTPNGSYDPSGIVKGWAIQNAAEILRAKGFQNFYVEAGGDIEVQGHNGEAKPWAIGIRNPFAPTEIVKTIHLTTGGIATSGTSMKGQHIYSPLNPSQPITDIVSLTVIAPTIYEADVMATAAFAMGWAGINFIESRPNLEGYMIDADGVATMTSNFEKLIPIHV